MPQARFDLHVDNIPVVRLESKLLQVDIAPSIGGRVISVIDKAAGQELLWRNPNLKLQSVPPGSPYDPNFYGGIDELIPNDLEEELQGVKCPDHGELWTAGMECQPHGRGIRLSTRLPSIGLSYTREMFLADDKPCLEFAYRIENTTDTARHFLWKLHAAVPIAAGDVIDCPAKQGQVVDPAWSRFRSTDPFPWPNLDGQTVNLVPPRNGTMDFFYLYELEAGRMAWRRPGTNLGLAYEFDLKVFPYCWLFASYGGFDGHYTAILEPCSTMPLSVATAAPRRQCTRLDPGAVLTTRVRLWAGAQGSVP